MVNEDRRYPARPIAGVGAIIIDGDRVLLVERGREPLKGEWSLPGGAVECGETIRQAVRREVMEETGLEVEPLGAPEVFERILLDSDGRVEYHYLLLDFVCRVVAGTLHAASDASRAEWVDRARLSSYSLTEGTSAVIESIRGLFLPEYCPQYANHRRDSIER